MSFNIKNNFNQRVKITRNGSTQTITGGNVVIDSDGNITVNGKPLSELEQDDGNEKNITITIEGSVERLQVESCNSIRITGDCGRVKATMGDVEIGGNVDGDVHANMGSITCGDVYGDCHANMGSIIKK